ncbi:LysM peptidoglycan-binding domain-containing protein [Tritonibacter scottomollicae]|uniref:LysM peptidoglycan-binding domain-containing protein n=1 Tax=Tritonibacter scottomollicae TaxID=483013 RepID=A0ABZ0HI01_TRISK|nr:LysM peptidoglycan-binding domain-containing protein [Tritonibacter scottomollicae]WOI34465.1 LysM peptidoglycan-binding domain-containing protein [Tritonibacter scottomollicae]
MTKSSGIGAGAGVAIGTVATVVVVCGGFFLARGGMLGDGAQSFVARQLVSLGLAVPPAPMMPAPSAQETDPAQASSVAPETAVPDERDPGFVLAPPKLEVARFDMDGSGIVAASAQAGVEVQVLLDGQVLDSQTVPAAGEFVSFVTITSSSEPRVLSLLARFQGQEMASEDNFILAPVQLRTAEADDAWLPLERDSSSRSEVAAPEDAGPEEVASDTSAQDATSPGPTESDVARPMVPDDATQVASDESGAVASEDTGTEFAASEATSPQTDAPDVVVADVAASDGVAPETVAADPVAPEQVVADVVARAQDEPQDEPSEVSVAETGSDADNATASLSAEADASESDSAEAAQSVRAETETAPDPAAGPEVVSDETQRPAAGDTRAQLATPPAAEAASDGLAEVVGSAEPARPPVVATDDAGSQPSREQARVSEPQATSEDTTVEADGETAPQPDVAVTVLRAGKDGVSLVQPATPVAPELVNKVALDTISYTETGDVQLAGRAQPEALVRVYLDNSPVTDIATASDGRWSTALTSVAPGIYTLRLDEISLADGSVSSRLETPFKREAPEVLQPALEAGSSPDASAPAIQVVTVQEGDSLWAISQERYGSGFLYVRVFEANKSDIRDPDLIYPGQIFTLPK